MKSRACRMKVILWANLKHLSTFAAAQGSCLDSRSGGGWGGRAGREYAPQKELVSSALRNKVTSAC